MKYFLKNQVFINYFFRNSLKSIYYKNLNYLNKSNTNQFLLLLINLFPIINWFSKTLSLKSIMKKIYKIYIFI